MADNIAEALAMLLPPGILFDSPQIYAEVAKLPVVPLEDIRRHWHAYTSMYKKLQDPTACRLENFWWHVWGSDKRNLSGKTLATLWKEIASGPTFVPLMAPTGRHNGPPKHHTRSLNEAEKTESSSQIREPKAQQDDGLAPGPILSVPPNLTPSSSRPPPPHPILKKPRGPSSSGPRPTARFVDIPDSEDDASLHSTSSQQSGSVSQSDTSSKGRSASRTSSRSRSPAKLDKRLPAAKKFVASTTTSKRRPMLPRRQSSQSSTGSAGSDVGSREGNSSMARPTNHHQGSAYSPAGESPSRRQGHTSGLPTQVEEPVPNNRAHGKRLAHGISPQDRTGVMAGQQFSPRGSTVSSLQMIKSPLSREHNFGETVISPQSRPEVLRPSTNTSVKKLDNTPSSDKSAATHSTDSLGIYDGSPGRSRPPAWAQSIQTITANTTGVDVAEKEKKAAKGEPARDEESSSAAPLMTRSKSNESKRMSTGPVSTSSFKSPSVVGMSSIAVTGGFDFETPRPRPSGEDLPVLGPDQPDIRKPSLLDSKFSPTQPSPAPAPPMGRSKSQLTLLLERDKARIGDRHKVGSTHSQKGDSENDTKRQG